MNPQILIEPIVDGKPHGIAVQAKTFQFSLKITNHSNSPSEAFTITQVVIGSAQGQNINDGFGNKSFSVGVINPEQSVIINVGKNGQFMFGLIMINVDIVPNNAQRPITCLQKNPFTGNICEVSQIGTNRWVDFFYIKSSSEDLQEETNRWLVILSWVIAISALITISPVLLALYHSISLK